MCTALLFIKLLNENIKWVSLISSSQIIEVEQYLEKRLIEFNKASFLRVF